MAAAPLVTVEEFSVWLRKPLDGSDAAWAGMVLDVVSSLVRSEAGVTWDGVEVPAPARAVTLEVAARVYRNPEAATSYSKTRGPFGDSITWADPTAVGLYLSDRERRLVRPRASGTVAGLWTLGTTRADPAGETIYVPVEGAPPFPWYSDDVEV